MYSLVCTCDLYTQQMDKQVNNIPKPQSPPCLAFKSPIKMGLGANKLRPWRSRPMGSNGETHLLSPSPRFRLGHSGNICLSLRPAVPEVWE